MKLLEDVIKCKLNVFKNQSKHRFTITLLPAETKDLRFANVISNILYFT